MTRSAAAIDAKFTEKLEEAEFERPPVPVARANPSKLRFALLMVVTVYPLITALLYAVTPLTVGWDIWQRTLVIAPLMVFSIVFYVSPTINRHFGWFVAGLPRPTRGSARQA